MSVDKIVEHMMKGVVFHNQLSEYYRFLNLNKYADFHCNQAKEEFDMLIHFEKWYITYHEKLIPTTPVSIDHIIPVDWYSHVKQDVDKNTVREGVKNGHIKWVNWEAETKKLYEDEIKASESELDKIELRKLLKEVSKELAKAKQKYIVLKNQEYDICQIFEENRENLD